MKRNLPPLNALKVFESVARNLSFSKAAKELFITQSAVSKQIKLLEEYLNEPLLKGSINIDADIAIRVNNTPFENIENELLMEEIMALICSPSLIKDKIQTPADIINYTFLEHTSRPDTLKNWLTSVGINANLIKSTIGFEHFFMLIAAAKNGLGIAMIPKFLVEEQLKNGEFINLFNVDYKTGFSYYLLYPKNNCTSYKARKYRHSLLKSMALAGVVK